MALTARNTLSLRKHYRQCGTLCELYMTKLTAGAKGAADRLQAAMDQFEAAGGYDADKRIANVLTGLGFKQEDWNKGCNQFSGGWQVRHRSSMQLPQ